ncbi:MAG: prolipoprotein diacylglyceryl transferase [Bacteroidetes bacterium GWF2_42_66]|nr:MAG: prolipoprotein diacylglyceryl transferase [Bacteroidetes bacterium GWA2_42_15]OFX98872.1 MAG: prolipoprotein diacylglyceryl transferase [Bacteroidetes bacterium GWE2_42_39]OFY45587.1 MAG: prolipoprotein diacylglyceryl transferase [Bacteroidetes bacterium GWF2_42_66]HBL77434.1 prolipoprotein diacylglyceryl transferase [Prolixibacteraceae bacterium]HCU62402.1 prolipoprotein diacylglyceryl transferase [Prolixibacteraceae bacterium]
MMDFITYIHWDVSPEIFKLGWFSVRWYGLMFAVGFLGGYYMGERMFKYEKIDLKWLESLFMYLIIATIVGARLGHVIFYGWDYYSQHPFEIIKVWHGGLASHGGALGIAIALFYWSRKVSKRPLVWVLDRVVIPTALVAALIRFGNLMNSEIYGVETTMPWGFIFLRNDEMVAKHPTQIYESLSYLITFGTVLWMYWKTTSKDRQGLITGVFFIMVFAARFFIEFVKEDQEAFEAAMTLNMGQILSIPFVLTGIFLVLRALKRELIVYKV